MAKVAAVKKAVKFGNLGASPRDKAILFSLGLINQLDHRRHRARRAVHAFMSLLNGNADYLKLHVRLNVDTYFVYCRFDDFGDYQTVWECLGGMYNIPDSNVRYIFDGGANLGLFTLAAIANLPIEECLVVEPDGENFALMERNLAFFPRLRKVRGALAKEKGRRQFIRTGSNTGYLQALAVSQLPCSPFVSTNEVSTFRVLDLFPTEWDLGATWMKLDIEGAEYAVINDMLDAGLRPAFVSAELHDFFGAGGSSLVKRLCDSGYRMIVSGSGDSGNVCRQIHASLRSV